MPARGTEIVAERLRMLPDLLRGQLREPPPVLPGDLREKGLIITGVGSSEAAARYAAHLFAERGLSVRFRSFSEFYASHAANPSAAYLMLFTQGLSPNAEIVLRRRSEFGGLILVSSSSVEGQRAAGKPERAEWLERLQEEGAFQIRHLLENEYEILPRFLGPVCVMLEVCRMVERVFPGSVGDLTQIPDRIAENKAPEVEIAAGSGFFFTNSTLQYAQNLACKVLETLLIPAPFLADALTYAHGPFQVNCRFSSPNVIFTGPDPLEEELCARLLPLFEKAGPVAVISSTLPPPLAVFEYEAALNCILEKKLATVDVDLINWPGKGLDAEGYGIRGTV